MPIQDVPVSRGQVLRVDWHLQSHKELPAGYRNFVRSLDATASARATNAQIISQGPGAYQLLASANQAVSGSLSNLLPGDAGALATGIVTGNDSGLSEETVDNFRATGTAHITAVSGQNVTIILGFLSFWYQPKSVHGRLIFHATLLLVVWTYAVFVGLESPALRAAIVASLTIIGRHVGRRPDPVTLLALTLGGIAFWNPMVVHTVGFWLSATASMALCLALPKQLSIPPGEAFIKIVLGPIAAAIATMPIVLMSFGTWSPVSILANILISPVITLAFWITYPFAVLAVALPGVASTLSWIPGIVLDTALVIVHRLAPVASQIRVDAVSPFAMLVLWLPIGTILWLLSGESNRWIRRAIILRHQGLR